MARPQVIIDETGISAPSYEEWLAYLLDSFGSIYGTDTYVEADSQDGQMLGIFAQSLFDMGNTAVDVYNAFSPVTGQGAGLSSVVKVNGLKRRIASNSTVDVTIVGQPGRTLINGLITDNLELDTRWSIPTTIIPDGGEIIVTATNTELGDIKAAPGTLTQIISTQPGWQTVTNVLAATPGAPVERDAELRKRQSISTSEPALLPLKAIVAGVANLAGVTRVTPYENDTDITNAIGVGPHAISLVVRGGDVTEIANAIANKIMPGVGTFGTTSVVVVDQAGVPNTINFMIEVEVNVYFLISLLNIGNYITIAGTSITTALDASIDDQKPGTVLYANKLYPVVELCAPVAAESIGSPQAVLDSYNATYNINYVAISREEMVTSGSTVAGATTMTVTTPLYFSTTLRYYTKLDDDTVFSFVVSSIVGSVLTFAPAVPALRNIPSGGRLYGDKSVTFAFNEAPVTDPDKIVIIVV